MDKITFEKIWQDGDIIELKISANSEFVSAYQSCYIQDTMLQKISKKIRSYVNNYHVPSYLEFGKKKGNYTPAFSMCLLPANSSGHMKIEVDIEIADNDLRAHRCCFYVESELGLVEQLGYALDNLLISPIGAQASLL